MEYPKRPTTIHVDRWEDGVEVWKFFQALYDTTNSPFLPMLDGITFRQVRVILWVDITRWGKSNVSL